MARYFFNFRVNGYLIPDQEGDELANLQDALLVAKRVGRRLATEREESGGPLASCEIVVTDEAGVELFAIPLVEVAH